MICKGCGEDKKLIKAHAIPESFFVKLRQNEKSPLLVTNKEGRYPKKSPIGVYDPGILCRDCEELFQEVDDYGQDLLLQQEDNHESIIINNTLLGYKIRDVNHALLKKFFISVLWRASISTHDFYSRIKLGPHEEKLKGIIWNNEIDKKGQFDCVLAKFIDTEMGLAILDPHMERWGQINYARFYMYGYIVYIKVDARPTPKNFEKFVINNNGNDLIIVGRNLLNSKEYPLMLSLIKTLNK